MIPPLAIVTGSSRGIGRAIAVEVRDSAGKGVARKLRAALGPAAGSIRMSRGSSLANVKARSGEVSW